MKKFALTLLLALPAAAAPEWEECTGGFHPTVILVAELRHTEKFCNRRVLSCREEVYAMLGRLCEAFCGQRCETSGSRGEMAENLHRMDDGKLKRRYPVVWHVIEGWVGVTR